MMYLENIVTERKNTMECFDTQGIKTIRVRKESKKYDAFDLNSMEIIEHNQTGVEIIFLISKNKNLSQTEQLLKDNYDVESLIMNLLVKNNTNLDLLD